MADAKEAEKVLYLIFSTTLKTDCDNADLLEVALARQATDPELELQVNASFALEQARMSSWMTRLLHGTW